MTLILPGFTPCEMLKMEGRFWALTRRDAAGCRIWIGATSIGGIGVKKKARGGPYGSFNVGRGYNTHRAHVVAALLAGKIPSLRVPAGFQLDHECEKTLCVDCTELVPKRVNLERRWRR